MKYIASIVLNTIVLVPGCFATQPPSLVPIFDRLVESTEDPSLKLVHLEGRNRVIKKESEQANKLEKFKNEMIGMCRREDALLNDFIRMFNECVKSPPESREQHVQLLNETFLQATSGWRNFPENLKTRENRDIYDKIKKSMSSNNKVIRSTLSGLSDFQGAIPSVQHQTLMNGLEFPILVINK